MDNTHQFDNKSEIYDQARSKYAEALLKYLKNNLVPKNKKPVVADIGSGTGIFTAQLLKSGYFVYAVEPNQGMRQFAEKRLTSNSNFRSIAGQAENTGLPNHSVDLVTTAQAFHWFNPQAFKKECQRILKPDGYVVIVYNSRFQDDHTDELVKILQQYCPRFHGFSNNLKEKDFKSFFDKQYQIMKFSNPQEVDKDKYIARVLSSSYSLNKNDPHYQDYLRNLNVLADRIFKNKKIKVNIITTAYIGRV